MKRVDLGNFNNDNEGYTFEEDIEKFLDNTKLSKDKTIGCPFDREESNFVKVLKDRGYTVINTHIDYGQDFFSYEPQEHYDFILSNPPFSGKAKVIERMIQLDKPFALIYGIQCFSSGGLLRL